MDDEQQPRQQPWDGWSVTFVLLWPTLLLGAPLAFVVGGLQTITLMGGGGVSAADRAEQDAWWTAAWIIAFAVPVLGLGLAIWKRRKASAIAFAVALCLVLCGGATAVTLQLREADQREQQDQPPPPAGCFGDSPADEGNPACKGG